MYLIWSKYDKEANIIEFIPGYSEMLSNSSDEKFAVLLEKILTSRAVPDIFTVDDMEFWDNKFKFNGLRYKVNLIEPEPESSG